MLYVRWGHKRKGYTPLFTHRGYMPSSEYHNIEEESKGTFFDLFIN